MRTTPAVLCAILLATACFAAADKPTCAVLTFDAKGGVTAEQASLLTDRFAAEMDRTGRYTLTSRQKMAEILKLQEFARSDNCSAAECAIEAGKLLSVRYMIYGSIARVGSLYTLNTYIADIESGATIRSAITDQPGHIEDMLTKGMKSNVNELLEIKAAARPVPPKPAPTPLREDINAAVPMTAIPAAAAKPGQGPSASPDRKTRLGAGIHVGGTAGGNVEESGLVAGAQAMYEFSRHVGLELAVSLIDNDAKDDGVRFTYVPVVLGLKAGHDLSRAFSAYVGGGAVYQSLELKGMGTWVENIETEASAGFQASVGVQYRTPKRWMLFAEYRHTWTKAKYSYDVHTSSITVVEEKVSEDKNLTYGMIRVGANLCF